MLSLGLVGVNTAHADAFSLIFNGDAETPVIIDGARITHIWGGEVERTREVVSRYEIGTRVAELHEMIDQVDGVLIVDDTDGGRGDMQRQQLAQRIDG